MTNEMAIAPKRGAIYEVSMEALTALLRGRIPEDAKLVGVRWDDDYERLLFKVHGPSLPVVGQACPYERRELEV